MKLGFSTWAMPKVPIDTALDHIAAVGYSGIEITMHKGWVTDVDTLTPAERQRIRARVTALGLELPAVTCPGTLAGDPAVVEASMARVVKAMDVAVEWADPAGPPCVVTIPGGKPSDWEDAACRQQLVDSTAQLAAEAERRGVVFSFEAHVLQIVETPDQMLWLMEQVPSPALKVNFDISHFDVLGIPTEESVQKLVPNGRSIHTHVKDQLGRSPNHQYLIPGEGDFDFVGYLRAMQAAGFTGYIVPEISLMVQRRPTYDPLAAATQSFAVLEAAFRDAGIERERP